MGKDIENLLWRSRYQGPLLVYAGMNFNVHESDGFVAFARGLDKQPPKREDILIGGIDGIVDLVEMLDKSDNIWFEGTYGWVLRNARPARYLPRRLSGYLA
jgi:hypothetical protein